jgi:hypothetical protein
MADHRALVIVKPDTVTPRGANALVFRASEKEVDHG